MGVGPSRGEGVVIGLVVLSVGAVVLVVGTGAITTPSSGGVLIGRVALRRGVGGVGGADVSLDGTGSGGGAVAVSLDGVGGGVPMTVESLVGMDGGMPEVSLRGAGIGMRGAGAVPFSVVLVALDPSEGGDGVAVSLLSVVLLLSVALVEFRPGTAGGGGGENTPSVELVPSVALLELLLLRVGGGGGGVDRVSLPSAVVLDVFPGAAGGLGAGGGGLPLLVVPLALRSA